jgi:hypothetical protein
MQRTHHLPGAVEGVLHIQLVDLFHQTEGFIGHWLGPVIARGARQRQELTLPAHA